MLKFIAAITMLTVSISSQVYAKESTLPTGIGSGKGVFDTFSFSTANLFLQDEGLSEKEKAKKAAIESCNDLIKSAEELAARKADEEITARTKSQCIDKLANINLDIKIPSLFDMLLAAAKKRIMDEIDRACAQVNNAVGSTTNFQIGGNLGGQGFGVGGGVVTGNGSSNGYVPPVPTTTLQGGASGSSNIPGVKF